MPLRRLIAGSALVMAVLLPVVLNVTSAVAAVGLFCLVGFIAGIRTPASASLGLEQLPGRPGAMMATRAAATQLGYLIGAVIGGAVIAGPGYGALGPVLAVGMIISAYLVLRVNQPPHASVPREVSHRTRE